MKNIGISIFSLLAPLLGVGPGPGPRHLLFIWNIAAQLGQRDVQPRTALQILGNVYRM